MKQILTEVSMEIFRAYDIRGEYPKDISDESAYKIARILARTFHAKKAVIGMDVSLASPPIKENLIKGLLDQGADVTDIGIAGTDMLYFATGNFKFDLGLEVTASHSAGYLSGIKIIGPGGKPFGKGLGMEKLKADFLNYTEFPPLKRGTLTQNDILEDFLKFALAFSGTQKIKPLRIAVDTSNAVGSLEMSYLEKHLPQLEFIKLNWELDGHYPSHQPNPLLKENRQQLVRAVLKEKADLGIALDGDADRIFFVDENGDYIFGVYISAMIAELMCRENPGRVVVHDVRATRYIRSKILEAGGIPKIELVGHAFFKNRMGVENAIFGAEASGHMYYNFGDFMAENSMIAFLQVLRIISEQNKTLGQLTRKARIDFPVSGEYNFLLPGFTKKDELTEEAMQVINKILDKIRDKYSDGKISDFDTLTIYYPDWNFNIRPSANDPVIRFTAEAVSNRLLIERQEEIFALLKGEGCQHLDDSGVELIVN